MCSSRFIKIITLITFLSSLILFSQIPNTLNYQGLLKDENNKPVADGAYSVTLRIYKISTGGTPIYTETINSVQTNDGFFNLIIGKNTQLNLPFDEVYWMGISVGTGTELTPRTEFTSVSYAQRAKIADGLPQNAKGVVTSINGTEGTVNLQGAGGTSINTNGQIITISSSGGGGTGIQGVQNTDNNLAITNANGPTATINFSTNASTNPKGSAGGDLSGTYPDPSIKTGAVTNDKLAEGAVTNSKVIAIDWSKITGIPTSIPPGGNAGGDLSGTYPNPTIGDSKVTNAKIQDVAWTKITGAPVSLPPSGNAGGDLTGTYPNPTIGDGKITTLKIGDNAITNAKIQDMAWTKITGAPASFPPSGSAGGDLTGTYPNPTIGDAKVTTAKIADNAITNAKIQDVAWSKITGAPSSTGWGITGNSGTNPTSNYMGTSDNQDFVIRTNGVERLRVKADGTGMTASPDNTVDMGTTTNSFKNMYLDGKIYIDDSVFVDNPGFACTFIGHTYNTTNSGSYNSYMGYQSGYNNSTGYSNTSTGYQSLFTNSGGSSNSAFGAGALYSNSSGNFNTAMGLSALSSNVNGYNNTGIGILALNSISSGSNNTAIGYDADVNAADLTNVTVIGSGALATASNQVRLGNGSIATMYCQGPWASTTASTVNMVIRPDGQIMRYSSSARYKREITDLEVNTEKIYQLRPVSYTAKSDGLRYFGLIAEEVAQVLPELADFEKAKDVIPGSRSEELIPDAVKYPVLSVLLLNELKKQKAVNDQQSREINELHQMLIEQKQMLEELKKTKSQ